MKFKSLVLFCSVFFQYFSYAQDTLLIALYPGGIAKGKPSLNDEFEAAQLNASRWYGYYPWGGLSLDSKTYTDPTMCSQYGGRLILSVDTAHEFRSFPGWMIPEAYKSTEAYMKDERIEINRHSSAIWSKEQFKYGYFECRCILPTGKGYWPAFWLYGGNPNEEIDIMEAKGERSKSYHVDVHCPNRCDRVVRFGIFDKPFGHWVKTNNSINGNWMTFSGLWTPKGVLFYANGELMATHVADFNTSMNLIANFSLAMDKGPFSPGPDKKTSFPATFTLDYIRAWQFSSPEQLPAIKDLKEALIVKAIPNGNNQVKFEFNGNRQTTYRIFIEKESMSDSEFLPVAELDLTVDEQTIDFTYWSSGTYYLRVLNESSTEQLFFIKRD
jgi:hypothetical protein